MIKVIIADDHPIFRSGMEITVKNMKGIGKVTQASNGGEVIKLLDHEHYDIVLMDIKMLPMDGIEATGIITSRFHKTKVIAISMMDDEKCIIEMLENGAVGYLIKNADKEEVEKAIKDVRDGHTYFSSHVSEVLYSKLNRKQSKDVKLKERYKDILFLLCNEFSSDEIASALYLSIRTIETYRQHLFEMTQTKTTIGLVKYGIDQGLINDHLLKKKFAKALAIKTQS